MQGPSVNISMKALVSFKTAQAVFKHLCLKVFLFLQLKNQLNQPNIQNKILVLIFLTITANSP